MYRSEIREYARKLVRTFGHEVDPNPYETNTPTLPTYLEHHAYGLWMYDKTSGIRIDFDNETVFDDKNDTYEPGIWEDILKEYHDKIPKILKDREDSERRTQKCDALYDRIKEIMYLGEKETRKELVGYSSDKYHEYTTYDFGNNFKIEYDNFNDYGKGKRTHEVYYNGELVFSRVNEDTYGNFEYYDIFIYYPTYVPGEWENEITRLEELKQEKVKAKHLNDLNKLRNL